MIPAKPRKEPKQSRSKMLVQSVKDACRRVLYKEGAEALTTAHLAEVAGISVGSLYQYFPNIEAVVAAVYDDIVTAYLAERKEDSLQNLQERPLAEALSGIVQRLVMFHRELLQLNYEFHSQYHRCFELDRGFNEQFGRPDYAVELVADAIRREGWTTDEAEIQLSAFMAMQTCKILMMDVMDRDPNSIFRPDFADKLYRICYAAMPVASVAAAGAAAPASD